MANSVNDHPVVNDSRPNWIEDQLAQAHKTYEQHLNDSNAKARPEELFLAMLAVHALMMHSLGQTQRAMSLRQTTWVDSQAEKVQKTFDHDWMRTITWTVLPIIITVASAIAFRGAPTPMQVAGSLASGIGYGDKIADNSNTADRMNKNHALDQFKSNRDTQTDQHRRNVGRRDETMQRIREAERTIHQAKQYMITATGG